MRLLTHNMLSSNIKGVTNGFPLSIEAEKVVEKEVELNADFLRNMFAKIEWKALVEASKTLGYTELPDDAEASMLEFDKFVQRLAVSSQSTKGSLICCFMKMRSDCRPCAILFRLYTAADGCVGFQINMLLPPGHGHRD